MEPPSHMCSVADRNVVMRRMTVMPTNTLGGIDDKVSPFPLARVTLISQHLSPRQCLNRQTDIYTATGFFPVDKFGCGPIPVQIPYLPGVRSV